MLKELIEQYQKDHDKRTAERDEIFNKIEAYEAEAAKLEERASKKRERAEDFRKRVRKMQLS